MEENKPGDMEMLSQPLLTEDGFLNESCMKELASVIKNMPTIHERNKDDTEWTVKRYTGIKEITGALAKWAVTQSPYSCPENLEVVIKYTDACLRTKIAWKDKTFPFAELSLCDISALLYSILYEQGFKQFDDWNVSKNKSNEEIKFVTAFDNSSNPDNDFIDLDALLSNVVVSIRDYRRKNDAFDKKFEEDWKRNESKTL